MGLMDKLNQLTQQLNNVADRLTNNAGSYQNIGGGQSVGAYGLGGLGNVYSTHENGVMESPVNQCEVAADNRKLTPYIDSFTDNTQYVEYIRNWFISTGVCNVAANGNCTQLQIQKTVSNQPFVENYNVFACKTQSDVDAVFKQIESYGVPVGTTVLIGYINFNTEQVNLAKHYKMQLIGVEGIQEINSAIDLADHKMPYIAFDKSQFVYVLATALNDKYKAQQQGYTGNTINDMAQGITASLNNIGEKTTQTVGQFVNNANVVTEHQVPNTEAPMNVQQVQLVKTEEQLATELAAEPIVVPAPEVSEVSLDKKSGISLYKSVEAQIENTEVSVAETLPEVEIPVAPVENKDASMKKSGVALG